MRRRNLAIPVKLWALACAILGISLTANTVLTCVLTLTGFAYLAAQRNWWLLRSFGAFFALLAVLLYLIRFHGLHMVVFSEFYVLMFWNLSPVFIVGSDHHTAWRNCRLPLSDSHAELRHTGAAGHVSLFPHHESRDSQRRAFHAQPGPYRPGAASLPSGGLV